MLTTEELELLTRPDVRRALEERIEQDPLRIALDKRLPHAATLATQVKYLQRARRKLPAWYRARCILPPRAFEQASSEACALHKRGSGGSCLDLTCGLGVDAWALAQRFERVVTLERDPLLCRIARENFRRLGVGNIEVINATAEAYTARCAPFDAVYADPDRRDSAGRRRVLPGDCSPDVVALLPRLRTLAPRITIKLSPLFDVDQALRMADGPALVEAVSLGGECKEVVLETGRAVARSRVAATPLPGPTFSLPWPLAPLQAASARMHEGYRLLIQPDAALQKARLVQRYYSSVLEGCFAPSEQGFVFADAIPDHPIAGRILRIARIERFDPDALRKRLKQRGVRRAELWQREFPLSNGELCRRLGIAEGGALRLAFTAVEGGLWAIELEG